MHATTKNANDVKKYFNNTFIICPEYDPNKMLYVEAVDSKGIYVRDMNEDKGLISIEDGGYLLQSPLTLRRQWFNCPEDKSAVLICRVPARMWKKGVASENTTFFHVNYKGMCMNLGFSPHRLHAFMENRAKFCAKIESFEKIQALSPLWMLSTDGTLFLLDSPVGRISTRKPKGNLLKEFSHIPLPPQLKNYEFKYV
jgi:hypothetical protein